MVLYLCSKCDKGFDRKSNYNSHINKKKSCLDVNNVNNENNENNESEIQMSDSNYNMNTYEDISDVLTQFTTINNDVNDNTCMYCETYFTRNTNLIRHLNGRCKSKKNFDELDRLKEKLDSVINNNEYLAKQIEDLRKENVNSKYTTVYNTNNAQIVNNNKSQINKGLILNNNLNIQLVQFGNEDIDNLDSKEALNVYMKSTGGNIIPNVLKYVHLNERYPQNHNICITDLSREFVKIFNGKKFVIKKFKNAKEYILGKVVKNTYKIVDKIRNDGNIKITPEIEKKLRINDISVKLIDGCFPDDIVREEIREQEREQKENELEKNNDNDENNKEKINDNKTKEDDKIKDNESNSSKEERDFKLAERLRIEHLESKQRGLQEITFEKLKEELYNGKSLVKTIH
jgi:hypothetical protein